MNYIKVGTLLVFLFFSYLLHAQWMSINNTGAAPDPNAALDISSNSKGLLIPRLTESERLILSTPTNGLLIFQTDGEEGFYFSKNGTWKLLTDEDYFTTDADADSTNELELPTAPNPGDMVYWNGSAWVSIAATAYDSATLQFISGVPTWVGGIAPNPYPAGTVHCTGTPTAVVDVTNPSTGKIWMDRNLGASQAATSSTDAAAYGDLYQWGRAADGHQCRNSATTSTLSSTDQPSHGDFITTNSSPYDWRSPQNTNLWQGVNGVNNPCPSGYRLPTETELNAERLSWSSNNSAGAFASPLKLPMAGFRTFSNGSLVDVGPTGYYWSSTVSSTFSRHLRFFSSNALMTTYNRANGLSVRCLKD